MQELVKTKMRAVRSHDLIRLIASTPTKAAFRHKRRAVDLGCLPDSGGHRGNGSKALTKLIMEFTSQRLPLLILNSNQPLGKFVAFGECKFEAVGEMVEHVVYSRQFG